MDAGVVVALRVGQAMQDLDRAGRLELGVAVGYQLAPPLRGKDLEVRGHIMQGREDVKEVEEDGGELGR